VVSVPAADRKPADTVVKLTLQEDAMGLPVIKPAITMAATASNTYQIFPSYSPQMAADGIISTRWATDAGVTNAWLRLDFPKPCTIGSVTISEALGNRVQKFTLECRDGDSWKPILNGTTIGADFRKEFPPVTTSSVRLNVLEATDGPTISEIEFGNP
jgi:alpha-L-fucosidase